MKSATNIIELPISETKDVKDLVKWLEKRKVYEMNRPTIQILENRDSPAIYSVGIILVLGLAFLTLEEKGKLNAFPLKNGDSSNDFLIKLKNCQSENSLEKLIESRYQINISLETSDSLQMKNLKSGEYSLEDIFGIWKNKKRNLENLRQEQWARKV